MGQDRASSVVSSVLSDEAVQHKDNEDDTDHQENIDDIEENRAPSVDTRNTQETGLRIDTDKAQALENASSTQDLTPTNPHLSKKRRLDLPPSPPWRSAAAQTPSSFVDTEGRKRSARTNGFPTPPRPDKPGHKTRSSTRLSLPTTTSSTKTTSVKNRASNTTPLRQNNKVKSSPTKLAPKSAPTRQSARVHDKGGISKSQSRDQTKTPSKAYTTKKPASTSKPQNGRQSRTRAQGRDGRDHETQEQGPYDFDEVDTSEPEENEEEETGDDETDENGGRRISLRLTFSRKLKPPFIPNINTIPIPRQYNSLREYFEKGDVVDPVQEEELVINEATRRHKIEEAYEQGVLRTEFLNAPNLDPHIGPERLQPQWAHRDHLVQQAIRFNKLIKMEKAAHTKQAKIVAIEAAKAAIKRRPKTREELEQEQITDNIMKYKAVILGYKARMKLVEKAAQDIRRERYLEAERAAGRETLKKMLHHSSALLGERIKGRKQDRTDQDRAETHDDMQDHESGDEDEDDSDDGFQSPDESNMSVTDDESSIASNELALDDQLTAEELHHKYASLAHISENMTIEDDREILSLPDLNADAQSSMLHDAETDDGESYRSTLEESDEDIPMDSEDDREYDEKSPTGAASDEEGDDVDFGGLLGFYSKTDLADIDTSATSMLGASEDHIESYEDKLEENVEEDEEEEELSEVEMVPVGRREFTSSPFIEDTILPGNESDQQAVASSPQNLEESDADDDEYNPTAEDVDGMISEKPQSTSSDTSSFQRLGVSDLSSATTPASTAMNIDVKDEAKTPIPHILRGSLREYQHHGLDWLAGLYDNETNGILADEMGLGKTIQTIALISHLATAKGIWGPHLIIVPTSVILNWEMEFKKWAPAFRILTYYGSREQRAEKRKGWTNDETFNVCISSYQLVVGDSSTFKRRGWHYMILDEAHNIKNFRSQRWQTLLNFRARARLLLTGTPLQNNLMELWSLLYFLMPSGSGMSRIMPTGFTNLKEFQDWFAHPVDQLMEGGRDGMDQESKDSIKKLHNILRPFLLRRLKRDVEKQMPAKYEHIVWCHLSKRQRFLYDEFMSRAQTRETLITGNYLSIINCLMQLKKVCNHPDLFETRQIVTSLAMNKSAIADFEIKELFVRRRLLQHGVLDRVNLKSVNLLPTSDESSTKHFCNSLQKWQVGYEIQAEIVRQEELLHSLSEANFNSVAGINAYVQRQEVQSKISHLQQILFLNNMRTSCTPIYGKEVVELCRQAYHNLHSKEPPKRRHLLLEWFSQRSETLSSMVLSVRDRAAILDPIIEKFGCITPLVVANDLPSTTIPKSALSVVQRFQQSSLQQDPFHRAQNRLSIAFPDKRLLQYDCGKLQKLDELLRHLQAGGHRALIFTQMTKVLDILEQFLNIHGHRYLRLDGATKIEQRQILTERFNSDNRILVFILSTRSGGLGINLTGADSVIFYDLDWNPAMDKQCQDRCHRIGQTRDVHIYRFVSEFTIESNILRKSNQKQMLDDVVIQEGEFTMDKFNNLTIADLFGDEARKLGLDKVGGNLIGGNSGEMNRALEQVEDADDVVAAKVAERDDVDILDRADFDQDNPVMKKQTEVIPEESNHIETPPQEAASLLEPQTTTTPVQEEMVNTDGFTTPAEDIPHEEAREEEEDHEEAGEEDEDHDDEEEANGAQSIDEYLLRFWVWELRNEPIIIPSKNKKKASKRVKPL